MILLIRRLIAISIMTGIPAIVLSQNNDSVSVIAAVHQIRPVNTNKSLRGDAVRTRITEKAREYIGVTYKWGESGENGFDCSGFVKHVFAQFGYTLPHSSYAQYNSTRRLIERNAKPGDLVFFVTRGQRISHVGIYLGNKRFIHASSTGKQVRIESLDTDYFRKKLAGFGTLL